MKALFFKTPAQLRSWLEADHGTVQELLVGFYPKASGKGGITYSQAVDEALCFGWIGGIRRRFDESSYTIRFTPRKPGSIWSAVNTKRVADLINRNRMHPAGRQVFDGREREKAQMYSYERGNCELAGIFEKQFRRHKKAWKFYQAQPPWYRRTSCWWVMGPKQESTRLRRLAQLMTDSSNDNEN